VQENAEKSAPVPKPAMAPQPAAKQAAAPEERRAPAEPRVENDPYAPKREQLDAQGRINPSTNSGQDDEQLDIPAFLRRQAN